MLKLQSQYIPTQNEGSHIIAKDENSPDKSNSIQDILVMLKQMLTQAHNYDKLTGKSYR